MGSASETKQDNLISSHLLSLPHFKFNEPANGKEKEEYIYNIDSDTHCHQPFQCLNTVQYDYQPLKHFLLSVSVALPRAVQHKYQLM